jgi:plastocyanin domain-containing protein
VLWKDDTGKLRKSRVEGIQGRYQQIIKRKPMKMKIIGLLTITLISLAAPATSFAIAGSKTVTINYTKEHDIAPNTFTVRKGEKVHMEINPSDTATGCMSEIMIPGLWDKPQPLVKGKKIIMEFTPQKPGAYKITCAMGVVRGVINVR